MGYFSFTVLTSFTLLMAYSLLLSGARAELSNSGDGSQVPNEILHKRRAPAVWLKTFPARSFKPLNSYSVYRRDLQPEVEFVDDSVNNVEKKMDDYGHMRFGKRGGGEGDGFDDYGHMRFGR